jgi:hypothetical protein
MADFDPDAYLNSAPAFDPDAYLKTQPQASSAEPADHGLSERRKGSFLERAASPITSYPETYNRMNLEAQHQMSRGAGQFFNPQSAADLAYGAGNMGLGALNFVGSPINAAYRSVIGQPVEDVTGIPREYTEFAAQLATPGLGFTKMPAKPGTVADPGAVARAVGRPGEVAGVADGSSPRIRTLDGPDLESPQAQANRALADEFDIPLTRGQATEDAGAIRFEDMAARGSYGDEMQGIAKPAFEDQFQAIQDAGQRIGQTVNRGEQPLNGPTDAASSLNFEVGERAAAARAERDKALQVAEQSRAQQLSQADQALARQRETAEQAVARQRQLTDERAQSISERIAGSHPEIESVRDAGEAVGQGVRDAAAANRADFRGRYDEFGRMEGTFELPAVQGMGTRAREELSNLDRPVVIDDHLTPAASRALQQLDEFSRPRIQNRAASAAPVEQGVELAGVNIQGMDRMRRHLVAWYNTARGNAEDARAVRAVINSFDNQIERAISDGLFTGDPRALQTLQDARASYARYQRTFHPQGAGDDVGSAMRRIVERNATPEEIANMVVGSGKLGNAGLPVRIADRLEQVLGADSADFNSIRQAIWQKASEVRNVAGEIDPMKSAKAILDFSGSTLARRMFQPEEIAAMRNHAQGMRELQGVADALPSSQRAAQAAHTQATKGAEAAFKEATAKARAAYEGAFGGEEFTGQTRAVFQRMAEGTATPEETANAMFAVIAGGNPGHAVRALNGIERIVGKDSPIMGSIRQGVWQKLTQNPVGKDPQGQQKLAQGINEFLNGKGKTIASKLYTAEERALMQRYADAVKKTVIGKYSRTNSDTAIASGAAAQKRMQHVASTIVSFLHTGPLGHIGGNWVAKKIGERVGKAANARNAQALRDSVNDFVPKQPPMTQGKPAKPPSAVRPFAVPRLPQSRDDRENMR